jgi:hypothetical protein
MFWSRKFGTIAAYCRHPVCLCLSFSAKLRSDAYQVWCADILRQCGHAVRPTGSGMQGNALRSKTYSKHDRSCNSNDDLQRAGISISDNGSGGRRNLVLWDRSYFRGAVPETRAWKAADNFQTFEQCPPRPRNIRGAFSAGNPQEGGRTHGGIGLLSLSPRMLQKIFWHGASLAPLA